MEYKDKKYTTSYKYFSNNQIAFVTSAKVGSRFMKSVSDELEWQNYKNPLNVKLEETEFNHLIFPIRKDFYKFAINTFYKDKEVVFLIRNPIKRFVSGLTTNISIIQSRCFEKGEDGTDFMKHYFETIIENYIYKEGIDIILKLIRNFFDTNNPDYLKEFITKYVLPQSIYKDSHVEFHHFMIYNYMNDLKEMGLNPKFLNIDGLDGYIKSKELNIWGYDDKMEKFKQTEKDNLVYKVISENIDTWKSEINELSLYFKAECEYYEKIQNEYEILL